MGRKSRHWAKHYHPEHIEGFTRLYWSSDKEKINELLLKLPEKYAKSLLRIYRDLNQEYKLNWYSDRIPNEKPKLSSVICRFGGYEFMVNWNNLAKITGDQQARAWWYQVLNTNKSIHDIDIEIYGKEVHRDDPFWSENYYNPRNKSLRN